MSNKCLICGKEALEDNTVISEAINRPLCLKHSLMLKGWLVYKGSDYTRKIEVLQSYIDDFIEKIKPKEEEQNDENED